MKWSGVACTLPLIDKPLALSHEVWIGLHGPRHVELRLRSSKNTLMHDSGHEDIEKHVSMN
jgi:hypothetical protein